MKLELKDYENMKKEAEMQLKQSTIMNQINEYILKRTNSMINKLSGAVVLNAE